MPLWRPARTVPDPGRLTTGQAWAKPNPEGSSEELKKAAVTGRLKRRNLNVKLPPKAARGSGYYTSAARQS